MVEFLEGLLDIITAFRKPKGQKMSMDCHLLLGGSFSLP